MNLAGKQAEYEKTYAPPARQMDALKAENDRALQISTAEVMQCAAQSRMRRKLGDPLTRLQEHLQLRRRICSLREPMLVSADTEPVR